MKRSVCWVSSMVLCFAGFSHAETRYKLPPREVVEIFDAPAPPTAVLSPRGDALLLVAVESNPPLALIAEPFLRLAGVRITPATSARRRTQRYTGLSLQPTEAGAAIAVALPQGAHIGLPVWSHDAKRFAFARDLADGVELWVGDAATGHAKPLSNLRLNDVLGPAFSWMPDNNWLLVRAIPKGRGPAPAEPRVPEGPVIDETAGKRSQVATYEDLLANEHDALLFEHYARSQMTLVDVASGAQRPVGEAGLNVFAKPSPDAKYLLLTRTQRPFSYRVPFQSFARTVEVWDAQGKRVATIADLPVSDEVPRQGVPTGPRAVSWQPLQLATLVWTEARDGGDPVKPASFRDELMTLSAPFAEKPRPLLRLKHRYQEIDWLGRRNQALVSERDRARRWVTTHLVDLAAPETDKLVFDRNVNDAYKDPGDPVKDYRPNGEELALQDGDRVYLAGNGASAEGDRPFLDALDLKTLQRERLFQSADGRFERFLGFVRASRSKSVIRSESPSEPPNEWTLDLKTHERQRLTAYQDPAPRLRGVKKELIKYTRKDGVALSGTLYLPADHKPGTRLPALLWAYPLEYSDADTAGQVRSSPSAFTRLSGPSPVFLVTQGYAVLMDATMPVVGDPETVNNTYVEQISESARAAVEKLDALGVADPKRVVVGGHSYGAFMTANLLAHTDIFVAGIAGSGAYNRTLTPFGFQTERRTFWEAGDVYMKMSPFVFANKINEPVLLTHGEADDNSGTFPIQSQRLFAAIRGNGGTARLVMLPHEAHGYRGRESVLHALAEMIDWADRWAKPHP